MTSIEQNRLDHQLLSGTEEIKQFLGVNLISDAPLELDRVVRYALFWKFYEGHHYRHQNDGLLSFNYVRAFIDKVNMFLLGKTGCTWKLKSLYNAIVEKETEKLAEEFLNYHWNRNKKVLLLYDMLQMGSVTGDLWCALSWEPRKKYVKIQCLDSRQCFPTFKMGDLNQLDTFTVRQALSANKEKFTTFVMEYSENRISTWYQMDAKSDGSSPKYREDSKENPYGFIPIVHIKNKANSAGYYSTSDANDILKLNKAYNEMSQETKGIIDYHTTPTTVITGASAKSLRRGIGNIWSGLPSEANVFNLGLDVDLSGMSNFMAMLKTSMHELSDVPENALGKLQAISNTSAAALQLTFQPLIQQADMKGLTYGEGIVEINEMLVEIAGVHAPDDPRLQELGPDFLNEMRAEPVWSYGFPQDRAGELQNLQMEFGMGLASIPEAMNRLGKENVPDLMREIKRDKIEQAETAAEVFAINPQGMGEDGDVGGVGSAQPPKP